MGRSFLFLMEGFEDIEDLPGALDAAMGGPSGIGVAFPRGFLDVGQEGIFASRIKNGSLGHFGKSVSGCG
jgi:hypothetical protein